MLQSFLAVSRISYSLPADILSANSSFMEAVLPQVFIQGVGGLIISAVLYPVLIAIPDVRQAAYEAKN